MEKIRTYKVFGMVEVLVAATSPEQAKRIAIGRYGMDVRATPEKAAHNVACEKSTAMERSSPLFQNETGGDVNG